MHKDQTQVPKKQDDSLGNQMNELYNNRNKKNYFAYGKHWPEEILQEINVFFQKDPFLQFVIKKGIRKNGEEENLKCFKVSATYDYHTMKTSKRPQF